MSADKERNRRGGLGTHRGLMEYHGNVMVVLTIVSVILSTLIAFKPLTPVLHLAAIYPFFYSSMKQHHHRRSVALALRWGIVLFVTALLVGVFDPDRLGHSLPFADRAVSTIASWISQPGSSPPADFPLLFWGMAAFLLGSAVSGGLFGLLAGAVSIEVTAYGALFIFRHSSNVVQIGFVVVPVWVWVMLLSGLLLLVPTAILFFDRFTRIERVAEGKEVLRALLYTGGGFFVLSLLLRATLAGAWRNLLQAWTIF